ncbi:Ger(x)C family spore germination protein [Pontibacillus yanchengensis]|uniref:Ger(X)C family spore germination protein n=2 Tax=Pontibacillus yanchengensis TaxID=462910 RepID=A0ACC7VDK6_9BACI|nr:Ger(x)C family spore germination protein [Pontibacillus yanchengensis]MYL32180.1 Ger(x)C family spore germination protein [Pontibacillus yanchengensis]MYL52760.1 Ger(x)C family spore germination protein [Pontibacillus yanchengensis]
MKGRFSFIFISFLILAGCQQNYSVEDRVLVILSGFDYVDDQTIKGTVAIPQIIRREKTQEFSNEVSITETASSIKELLLKMQHKTSKPISNGKLKVSLYGEKLAKEGILNYVEYLSRDPVIGRNISLCIVNGEAENLIKGPYNNREGTTAEYIGKLIGQNIQRGNFPNSNLHLFLKHHYAVGIDPILPVLKKENNDVVLKGIGILKDGVLVHTVPYSEGFFFKVLKDRASFGILTMPYQDQNVVLENVVSKVTYHTSGDASNPKFNIEVKVKGYLNEVANMNVAVTPKMIEDIESKMITFSKEKGLELINQFKEKDIDPFGFGYILKNRFPNFTLEKWKTQYPDVPISIDFKIDITHKGIRDG